MSFGTIDLKSLMPAANSLYSSNPNTAADAAKNEIAPIVLTTRFEDHYKVTKCI